MICKECREAADTKAILVKRDGTLNETQIEGIKSLHCNDTSNTLCDCQHRVGEAINVSTG